MSEKRKRVTLTFDNGPEPEVTPRVLDTLARYGVGATFFVLGSKVERPECAAIAQRARAEGHWIGNHTFTHTTPLGELDRASALREFDQTEAALRWLDQKERLFRPYGRGDVGPHLLHPAVVERLLCGGYTCVLWNSVPGDWRDPKGWRHTALTDCRTLDWALVVLHDLPTGAMAELDGFLQALREESFEITQEFPPACLPIRYGKVMRPIESYVASGEEARPPLNASR